VVSDDSRTATGLALSPAERAAARRVLARYRRLVLLGRARLPLAAARRLVGPDCAYHLYFRHAEAPRTRRRRRRPTRR
jgi:hypothetical protein